YDYAGHLLEIAYTLGGQRSPVLAVSMAGRRQLEGRLLAALDAARNRRAPALAGCVVGAGVVLALLIPIATATVSPPRTTGPDLQVSAAAAASVQQTQSISSFTSEGDEPGSWEIRPARDGGSIHMRLTEGDGSFGRTVDVKWLEELSGVDLRGPGGPVHFSVRRDAGTFTFEGVVRSGVGGGAYTFTPNLTFASDLVKRGFERPGPRDLRLLARCD